MRLVYKFRHPKRVQLDLLTYISKSLYNEANYIIRQEFIHNGRWIRYEELYHYIKSSINYKLLLSQTSQQILRVLDKNWVSYFTAIKDWRKHPEKYKGRPGLPKYKRKDGHFLLICTNRSGKIRDHNVVLTMSETFKQQFPDLKDPISIPIPNYSDKDFSSYQQIRVLPRRRYYEIEIVYKMNESNPNLDKTAFLSIDLGVNNLVTTVENRNIQPIIISGRVLKAINQFFNKRRAKLLSIINKQGQKWSNLLEDITTNRNLFVRDYLHKCARFIINYCLSNKIGNICFGKLKDIKDGVNLGRANNQNFVNIPLSKFKKMIRYKAELVGIKIYEVNESYTSKCSSLDLESVRKHKKYVGRRVKRGLFRGSNYLLNADVNGALNILRKVIGDDFIRDLPDRGCWFQPVRIRGLTHTSHEQFCLANGIT